MLLSIIGLVAVSSPADRSSSAAAATAMDHLVALLDRSPAPEYRRFGSPGMAAVADYGAQQLGEAGFTVVRQDTPSKRYAIDYAPEHKPLLERISDGTTFKVDSTFGTQAPTGPDGITCTVRLVADVTPGDCGFIPFDEASPEWNNLQARAGAAVDEVKDAGGVVAVIQGDTAADLVFALRLTKAIPSVVAVVDEADVVGQQVRVRAMGAVVPATLRNVIGVRRPPPGSTQYVLLQGHADGFYGAAADNGSGTAAVLRAAQVLATEDLPTGLIVALYDGEEFGLLGSKVLGEALLSSAGFDVGDCGAPIAMAHLKAVVNLDASSARASDVQDVSQSLLETDVPIFSWRAIVYSEEPVLAAVGIAGFAAAGVLGAPLSVSIANEANGGIARTDGKWFHEAGVPVIWPVAGYPEYHTDGDDVGAVDPADLEAVAEGAAEVVRRLAPLPVGRVAGAPALPASNPPPVSGCAPGSAAVGGGGAAGLDTARIPATP